MGSCEPWNDITTNIDIVTNNELSNGPFSYSTKVSGSSDIFIQFHTRGSIEWCQSFDRNFCAFENSIKCNEISFDSHSLSE